MLLGRSYDNELLFVYFCIRNGDTVRLISARKPTKKKERYTKQIYNEFDDPLKKEIEFDPKSFKKNPFAKLITPEQKLAMIISAAFEDSKMTKEQFKREVDML